MTTIESKIGRVKWYNLDLRYGFITILDNNTDIFVHKNNISSDLRYKCLFKGEYVELDIINTDKGLHVIILQVYVKVNY